MPFYRQSVHNFYFCYKVTYTQLNHSSNPLLMSRSSIVLPTLNQMLALTSALEVFGTQAKTHFLMLGFSTQTRQATIPCTTTAAYRKHELAKKREYAQRVREVEHGVFTPLVLSTTGGMGREAETFYKRLADGISRKERKEYSVVMGWIRCRLSFAILRSAILCIRGSRSSRHRPVHELNIALATSEGCVPSDVQ